MEKAGGVYRWKRISSPLNNFVRLKRNMSQHFLGISPKYSDEGQLLGTRAHCCESNSAYSLHLKAARMLRLLLLACSAFASEYKWSSGLYSSFDRWEEGELCTHVTVWGRWTSLYLTLKKFPAFPNPEVGWWWYMLGTIVINHLSAFAVAASCSYLY